MEPVPKKKRGLPIADLLIGPESDESRDLSSGYSETTTLTRGKLSTGDMQRLDSEPSPLTFAIAQTRSTTSASSDPPANKWQLDTSPDSGGHLQPSGFKLPTPPTTSESPVADLGRDRHDYTNTATQLTAPTPHAHCTAHDQLGQWFPVPHIDRYEAARGRSQSRHPDQIRPRSDLSVDFRARPVSISCALQTFHSATDPAHTTAPSPQQSFPQSGNLPSSSRRPPHELLQTLFSDCVRPQPSPSSSLPGSTSTSSTARVLSIVKVCPSCGFPSNLPRSACCGCGYSLENVAATYSVQQQPQAGRTGPGKGKKHCPTCDRIVASRARACVWCGHVFTRSL